MRFEVFTVTKIQVVVFWVLMQCSGVVGYHYFRGTCCFHLCHPEDGGSKILQNTDILPHHYMASQPRRPQLRNDMLWDTTHSVLKQDKLYLVFTAW